jgi:release factor glutamine methyltransferase
MNDGWTVGRVVKWAADDFRTRGIESPRLEAELLLAHALGIDRMRVVIETERFLAEDELARYRQLIQRRRKGEPVAYIRGYKEFYGRVFHVDARVLVPRPDTEVLVETALRRTAELAVVGRYCDLCTGSGCVAISLARERPSSKVFAVDLSGGALLVARNNSVRLGAAFQVAWLEGDLFEPLSPFQIQFDLVTANPPYIPEGELSSLSFDILGFEPRLALSGGPDGLALIRRIVGGAVQWLRPGGVLALEMGTGQAERVRALFQEQGFVDFMLTKDYGGHDRVASGVRP